MQFKDNTPVVTSDGHEVGSIDRVVIDPQTKEVTHLIVRKGWLFVEDKVVAVDLVAQTTDDQVILGATKDALPDFPPFEVAHYAAPDEDDLGATYSPGYARPIYGYPPIGARWWWGGYPYYSGMPGYGLPAYPSAQPPVEVERNIPEQTVALKEGAKVIGRNGDHIGDVERVYTESQTDRATHLVISKGWLLKEKKLIPVAWVKDVTEEELRLSVGSSVIERLPDFQE